MTIQRMEHMGIVVDDLADAPDNLLGSGEPQRPLAHPNLIDVKSPAG